MRTTNTKIFDSFEKAVADIPNGATVMMHSIAGPGGIPQNLILALRDRGVKNLTLICCTTGTPAGTRRKPDFKDYIAPDLLIENNQVVKLIACWATISRQDKKPTDISASEAAIKAGRLKWEPAGQGTLAERIRAGGAGLGPFYTTVGVGTILESGKEKRVFNGREYILEMPLTADYSFVRAYRADTLGNLVYKGTSRSYNPLMAMAGRVTIAEVDEIVEAGELDPEAIVTPAIFVDRIVKIPEGG